VKHVFLTILSAMGTSTRTDDNCISADHAQLWPRWPASEWMTIQTPSAQYKLDGCTAWNAHNTVFSWKRQLSVHKLFTSCIRRCLVSRACDWVISPLSAVLYLFSVSNSVCFSSTSVAGYTAVYVFYPKSDIGRCGKFGKYVSCTKSTSHSNDFELILTLIMETINHVERYFGSEFWAICNHCGVMAAGNRKMLKFVEEFLHFFWKKNPDYGPSVKFF